MNNIYTPERIKDEPFDAYKIRRKVAQILADGLTSGYFFHRSELRFAKLSQRKRIFLAENWK